MDRERRSINKATRQTMKLQYIHNSNCAYTVYNTKEIWYVKAVEAHVVPAPIPFRNCDYGKPVKVHVVQSASLNRALDSTMK